MGDEGIFTGRRMENWTYVDREVGRYLVNYKNSEPFQLSYYRGVDRNKLRNDGRENTLYVNIIYSIGPVSSKY